MQEATKDFSLEFEIDRDTETERERDRERERDALFFFSYCDNVDYGELQWVCLLMV